MTKISSFLGSEDIPTDYVEARNVILPVPYERTTSYGKGTRSGPQAIVEASHYLEVYDEEVGGEPAMAQGIHTRPLFEPTAFEPVEALAEVEAEARRHLESGKFLITLGGEHALTLAPARAARAVHGEIGVVQFDAHADLRETYEGTPYSHASVMKRLHDLGMPHVAIGIRALCRPEAELIRDRQIPTFWGHELDAPDLDARVLAAVAALPKKIYLTFDVDFLDPSLMPATGTPEPGGGFWNPTLRLLREILRSKEVVAMDVVELIGGHVACDFLAAKLVAKCIAYRSPVIAS